MLQLRVTVVNDHENQRNAEVATLLAHEYQAVGVSTIEDVDEIPDATFPDLFIITCSHGTGYALAQRIRERSSLVGLLLVVASGDADSRSRAFRSGADNYLIKPYAMDELLAIVKNLSRFLMQSPISAPR